MVTRSEFVQTAVDCRLLPEESAIDAMLWGHPAASVIAAMPEPHDTAETIASKITMGPDSDDTRAFAAAFDLSLAVVAYIFRKGA